MVTTTIPVAGAKVLVVMAIIARSVCPRAFVLSNRPIWARPTLPYRPHTSRRADPTPGRSRVMSVNDSYFKETQCSGSGSSLSSESGLRP
jgi:hypothetical protein